MKHNRVEQTLIEKVTAELPGAAPGVVIQAYVQGQKRVDVEVGTTYPYYDFASLTKISFTVQAMMLAFDRGLWTLKTTVREVVPWFPHENVRITDCLTHSSGLVWWLPFFEKVDLQSSELNRWTEGARIIRDLQLIENANSVYSDVGFIVLGHILENIYSRPLIETWNEAKELFYPKSTLNFHPHNKPVFKQNLYAPTEHSEWRKKNHPRRSS